MESAAQNNASRRPAPGDNKSSNEAHESRPVPAMFAHCDKEHGDEAEQARRIAEEQEAD